MVTNDEVYTVEWCVHTSILIQQNPQNVILYEIFVRRNNGSFLVLFQKVIFFKLILNIFKTSVQYFWCYFIRMVDLKEAIFTISLLKSKFWGRFYLENCDIAFLDVKFY